MIEIRGDSEDKRAARLSNFTKRQFIFEDVPCNSLEGFLQSLKVRELEEQRRICLLVGMEAKKAGQTIVRRDERWLYWNDDPLPRDGREYFELLTNVYDAAYNQDPTFREDLLATGTEELRHMVGKSDPARTILTEAEFLCQIYRLRARANFEWIG